MAISYLTIAAGTGSCSRLSFWSAQAIEKYTGLHSIRAGDAIKALIAEGHIALGKKSSRTRPRYEFRSYEEGGNASQEKLIWLPNTLITGTPSGEKSPARRLRSRGDLDSLRLLIDLYQVQYLSAEGGISRTVLRKEYERKKCGESGRHVVWGFVEGHEVSFDHPITRFWKTKKNGLWRPLQTLQDMGLLEIVPHLVENSNSDCEPIHGFGWDGVGEPIEIEVGKAADEAGKRLLGLLHLSVAQKVDCVQMFAPAWDTQPDVQMVGVYRLTYRPQTELTANWYRRISESAQEWFETYQQIRSPNRTFHAVSGF